MKQYKVYVIIVTYYGIKWINKCLSALVASPIVKPIVIDNGSTDKTTEFILPHLIDIEIVETEKDLGFGKVNNIGLKKLLIIMPIMPFY
jgi:GT2 family glycosyltransferase